MNTYDFDTINEHVRAIFDWAVCWEDEEEYVAAIVPLISMNDWRLVTKYSILIVKEQFVPKNYLHSDRPALHKENVHDRIYDDLQLSKISMSTCPISVFIDRWTCLLRACEILADHWLKFYSNDIHEWHEDWSDIVHYYIDHQWIESIVSQSHSHVTYIFVIRCSIQSVNVPVTLA
jgi:hypothetical protein